MATATRPPFAPKAERTDGQGDRRLQDVIARVEKIDAENGIVYVTAAPEAGQDQGKNYTVSIRDKAGAINKVAEFEGNFIDNRMESAIPAGAVIVLEGLLDEGKENDGWTKATARWIVAAPPVEGKLVRGLITASSYHGNVNRVQVWHENAFDLSDTETLDSLKNNFDQKVSEFNGSFDGEGKFVGPVKPRLGFQLRAVNESGEIVHLSDPISWNEDGESPASQDGQVKGGMITGEYLQSWAEWYKGMAQENGLTPELVVFRDYKASKDYNVPASGPLNTMVRTRGPQDANQSADDQDREAIFGRTLGGKGILILSAGKLNTRTGERKGERNDYVNRIILSERKGHIHSRITGPNGEARTMHANLEPIFPTASQGQARQRDKIAEAAAEAGDPHVEAPNAADELPPLDNEHDDAPLAQTDAAPAARRSSGAGFNFGG